MVRNTQKIDSSLIFITIEFYGYYWCVFKSEWIHSNLSDTAWSIHSLFFLLLEYEIISSVKLKSLDGIIFQDSLMHWLIWFILMKGNTTSKFTLKIIYRFTLQIREYNSLKLYNSIADELRKITSAPTSSLLRWQKHQSDL